ncbi:MAG: GNAT family N-acyltransferase [Pseudomonadota bacterium]
MQTVQRGKFVILTGKGDIALKEALALRNQVFRLGGNDQDRFDAQSYHCVVKDRETAQVLAAFRMILYPSGAKAEGGYASSFYDLGNFRHITAPVLEVGRFCTAPGLRDPDVVRASWTAVTDLVQAQRVDLMFGCSSFFEEDIENLYDAFSFLAANYLAPNIIAPKERAPHRVKLSGHPHYRLRKDALAQIPPLLKTYLKMGGWVSDHAVIDHDLGTIHVLTGVEVSKIPESRAASLRRDAI